MLKAVKKLKHLKKKKKLTTKLLYYQKKLQGKNLIDLKKLKNACL